ncbi:MAG: TetR/AcrR family transcriptional regulator, partial [Dehalococcoidia bacterium]
MQLRTDARANRDRIAEAATELFAEHGLAVEMKDIAERAGVAVGTLYRHFDSKEDLLRAIVFDAIETIIAHARDAEAEADGLTALRRLISEMHVAIRHYGWLVEAMMAGELPPGLRAEVRARREDEEMDHLAERVVQRCIDQGTMRPDLDAAIASAMLFGTIAPWNRERVG